MRESLDFYPFSAVCPGCREPLINPNSGELVCAHEGRVFRKSDGIWQMLLPERQAYFDQFVREYEIVRKAEGRGSSDQRYYRSLPFQDLSGRRVTDWRVRASSYRAMIEKIIRPLESVQRKPLKILDMGAGNCWLTNRLAERGHHLAAVDLSIQTLDGLGAIRHYPSRFLAIQAEFDRLPIADITADLVIFNASFHYSTDYFTTLGEAMRVLEPKGMVILIDSPLYRDHFSGMEMVKEREAEFLYKYGFPSNSIPSENFLTELRIQELANALGLTWQRIKPHYGIRWMLKPWIAVLRGSREPARFHILIGMRAG